MYHFCVLLPKCIFGLSTLCYCFEREELGLLAQTNGKPDSDVFRASLSTRSPCVLTAMMAFPSFPLPHYLSYDYGSNHPQSIPWGFILCYEYRLSKKAQCTQCAYSYVRERLGAQGSYLYTYSEAQCCN